MNFKRIGRLAVCLLLVCCLLINASPIKAHATGLGTGVAEVAAEIVVACIFQALGAMVGADSTAFNTAVNDCVTWLKNSTSYVVNGMVQVVGLMNGDVATQSFVMKDIMQDIWQWMFDSGLLAQSVSATSHTFSYLGTSYTLTSNVPCELVCFWRSGSYYYAGYGVFAFISTSAADSLMVTLNGTNYFGSVYGDYRVAELLSIRGQNLGSTSPNTTLRVVEDTNYHNTWESVLTSYFGEPVSSVFTSFDLTLGQIQGPYVGEEVIDITNAQAYSDYAQGQIFAPGFGYDDPEQDEDEVPYLPVSIPSTTYDDVVSQTQTEAQLGQTELEFEQVQEETQVQEQITIQGLSNLFMDQTAQLGVWLGELLIGVTSIPAQILDGLTQILIDALTYLFVPRQEFLQEKIQTLTHEFAFADSIVTSSKAIVTGLSGITTSPPIIYIDLGANRGPHNLGGKTVFMDLSWYAEYKPTVDTLISAFLWITFIWRLLLKLPGIISGMPGDYVMASAHAFGLDNHLPSRSAAYEVQRGANRETIRRGPGK